MSKIKDTLQDFDDSGYVKEDDIVTEDKRREEAEDADRSEREALAEEGFGLGE